MITRAIIQARMLSSRLRGKSLMAVAGTPLLYRVINAVKSFSFVDEIVIATTKAEADDPIAAAANNLGVGIYRGDSTNVLKRYRDASADMDEEDQVLRFTADNPVYQPSISQKVYQVHISNNNDYTYIDGLSHIVPEFVKVRALREVFSLTDDIFDQEHVTPYLRKHNSDFKVRRLTADFSGLRDDLDKWLTIDNPEDLHRFEKMFATFQESDLVPVLSEIYKWLDREVNIQKKQIGNRIKLDHTWVGDGEPTYVIAEIGQNHNGDVEIAKKLIDMAVRCRANAVKFQKRDIPSELTTEAFNKPYDSPNSFGHTYGEHREFLELNEDEHKSLKEYANAQGITYFCTPCDVPSVQMMERIGVPFYKVASRDLTNIPLLEELATTKKPVIISTGMASLEDIDDALEVLSESEVIILQCTSQYPAALENVNLKAMDTINKKYGKIIGFSDHTAGIIASVAASVMGAAVIEKHVTLSRAMKGSDQAGSLEENGLRLMIKYIRETELVKGDGIKDIVPATEAAKIKLARSITSSRDLKKGEILSEDMICLKSPGDGLKWRDRNKVLGRKLISDIPSDTTIKVENFEY